MPDTPLEEAQDMLARAQAIGARVRENEQVILDMSNQDLEELRKDLADSVAVASAAIAEYQDVARRSQHLITLSFRASLTCIFDSQHTVRCPIAMDQVWIRRDREGDGSRMKAPSRAPARADRFPGGDGARGGTVGPSTRSSSSTTRP